VKLTETTPLLEQYLEIKKNYSDSILLFRMGDFYETFFEDAKLISEILNITLTSREYASKDVPLAGFPIKSADQYIIRLVKTNRKVAVCEQLEEPNSSIKLVRRGVVEVITPGTIMREALLSERENNYIAALKAGEERAALAVSDISTGEMYSVEFDDIYSARDYLIKLSPSEILTEGKNRDLQSQNARDIDKSYFEAGEANRALTEHFKVKTVDDIGMTKDMRLSIEAAGALIGYLRENQNKNLQQIKSIKVKSMKERMFVDYQTMRNLEIFERMNGEKGNSFISIIDRTKTPMGARYLRNLMRGPFNDIIEINENLSLVQKFYENIQTSKSLIRTLGEIGDIERINTRIAARRAVPRDLILLSEAVKRLSILRTHLSFMGIEHLIMEPKNLEPASVLIDSAHDKDKVLDNQKERFFRKGFDKAYDELLELSTNTSEMIYRMEEAEKKNTGISNLRIGYNSVMGYYIEITNSNKDKVPKEYIRKQTLKNAERYINDELKNYEHKILSAEERLNSMEKEMFSSIIERLFGYYSSVSELCGQIAYIDYLCLNAVNAFENDWVKPVIGEFDEIYIEDGRHPVVEFVDRVNSFTPNSLSMDRQTRVILLTGPNMSGKSTYLRQNALIIYMAHLGMFVPAKSARIPLTDRIFTRIGASDDISKGVSTLMAEMLESANIINNMTKKSFLVLDEIGRGTSTFDGLAIAWAILEYIHNSEISPKTLFATHYHELTELTVKLAKMKNYTTKVRKTADKIIFLRRVVEGATDESYGIEVAKMAGLPKEVTDNALTILKLLKESEMNIKDKIRDASQMQLFVKEENSDRSKEKIREVIDLIAGLDLKDTTPLEALLILEKLKNSLSEETKEKN
jgi:DNA mismatch repair protein MutS